MCSAFVMADLHKGFYLIKSRQVEQNVDLYRPEHGTIYPEQMAANCAKVTVLYFIYLYYV